MDVSKLRFTKTHEWVHLDGDIATVGITDYAVQQLTDLVFVELPAIGKTVARGEILGTVESVKAAGDVYAPISGQITQINSGVVADPGLLSAEPFGKGWLVKLRITDLNQAHDLISHADYVASTSV